MNISDEDRQWIEQFYAEFEEGQRSLGKEYVRPADYIERALKVLYGEKKLIKNQISGLRTYFRPE